MSGVCVDAVVLVVDGLLPSGSRLTWDPSSRIPVFSPLLHPKHQDRSNRSSPQVDNRRYCISGLHWGIGAKRHRLEIVPSIRISTKFRGNSLASCSLCRDRCRHNLSLRHSAPLNASRNLFGLGFRARRKAGIPRRLSAEVSMKLVQLS